jgi:hypothetical protein
MTHILIWIVCGILSLVVSYQTYKNTKIHINELWVIGITIFLLGPISLGIQLLTICFKSIKNKFK